MQMSKISLFITVGVFGASIQAQTLTRDNGAPVGDNQNSTVAGENGSVLLQDVHLIQKLQRFARERIPERVVHARGTDFSSHLRSVQFVGGGAYFFQESRFC